MRYQIVRITLGRRLELMKRVRGLIEKFKFLSAGATAVDRLEAAMVEAELQQHYLRWGLLSVEGIQIDGQSPTVDELIDKGPEGLCGEICRAIQRDCGLTENERKNS